jgi:hypothetical protein
MLYTASLFALLQSRQHPLIRPLLNYEDFFYFSVEVVCVISLRAVQE